MALSQSSYDAFNSKAQQVALDSVRKSAVLPQDLAFHRSVDVNLASQLDAISGRVLGITNRLLALSQASSVASSSKSNTVLGRKGKERAIQRLNGQDDVVDSFQSIMVDVVDQLFERTDTCLDEFLGRSKPAAIAINPPIPNTRKSNQPNANASKRGGAVVHHATYLSKPQLNFKTPPDNLENTPWYPSLPHKYNAKVPLGFVCEDDSDEPWKRHPYRYEVTNINYPSSMFLRTAPVTPTSLTSGPPLIFVKTVIELRQMLDVLRKADAIAVDLEHHDHRSYRGIVCLMQISTREHDWIVDTLVPEVREELHILNEVFTDPTIVKVFHGAESDIIWLQRDFSLYIVNLFDTFHASKVLDFPRHGLANLLEMYCDFTPDKQYQLADWRIRPLPEEMISYAPCEMRFLTKVSPGLGHTPGRALVQLRLRPTKKAPSPARGEVEEDVYLPHAPLNEVLNRSSTTALRVYEREIYDEENGSGPGGWEGLAKKWNKGGLLSGDNVQGRVYRAVHAWRDKVAREEDESPRYVLVNHHIFQFAEKPPGDLVGLLGMFPSSRMPPLIRTRARELLDVILAAVRGGSAEDGMVIDPPPSHQHEEETMAEPSGARHEENPAPEVPVQDKTNTLWSLAGPSTQTATSSKLFGQEVESSKPQQLSSYSSTSSSLFSSPVPRRTSNHTGEQRARFAEVLERIHGSLSVMPTTPQVPSLHDDSTVEKVDKDEEPGTTGSTTLTMEVEHPFVPASDRKARVATEVEEDTIIVVGQRSKKRKRKDNNKGSVAEAGGEGEATSSASPRKAKKAKDSDNEKESEKPFDFSTVPNILDDAPAVEAEAVKRKRKQNKGGGSFGYGDFPRPPKAHSELRSGNQTQTFRK
ncbi:hypothetical protein ONZ45_g260 [Pleurotus djamor]|nr:hypothetical protein ONZ45_g260 [Pleurotus djamor]